MDRVEFADCRQDTGKQNSQPKEEEEDNFWDDLIDDLCSGTGRQSCKEEGEENDFWFDLLLAECEMREIPPHKEEEEVDFTSQESGSRESRQGDVLNLKRKRSLSPPPSGNHNSDSETDSTPRQLPQKVDKPRPDPMIFRLRKSLELVDFFDIIHYIFKCNYFSPIKKEKLVQKTCELWNMSRRGEEWCLSEIEEYERMFPDWLCSSKWEATGDVMYRLNKDSDLYSLRLRRLGIK